MAIGSAPSRATRPVSWSRLVTKTKLPEALGNSGRTWLASRALSRTISTRRPASFAAVLADEAFRCRGQTLRGHAQGSQEPTQDLVGPRHRSGGIEAPEIGVELAVRESLRRRMRPVHRQGGLAHARRSHNGRHRCRGARHVGEQPIQLLERKGPTHEPAHIGRQLTWYPGGSDPGCHDVRRHGLHEVGAGGLQQDVGFLARFLARPDRTCLPRRCGVAPTLRAGNARRRRRLGQYPSVRGLQRRTRVDTELLGEAVTNRVERRQCLRLPSSGAQGGDEAGLYGLVEQCHRRGQLKRQDHPLGLAQRHGQFGGRRAYGVKLVIEGRQYRSRRAIGKPGPWMPLPETERLDITVERQVTSLPGESGAGGIDEFPERHEVQHVGTGGEHVRVTVAVQVPSG